ncbi:MAG: hypothetical protein IPK12_23345 [Gemmatimonadetes bacterium]|nr:hypothetical protein [Gemmatimonadota bacterium]
MTHPTSALARGVALMTTGALQRAECELTKAARELRALGREDLIGEIHDLRRRTCELVVQVRGELVPTTPPSGAPV